jgi:hypothetical protein
VALLRGSGIPSRYVHGELSTEKTQKLILSMFPQNLSSVVGYIPEDEEISDPANNSELLKETKDHMWVQYYLGKDVWADLDPCFKHSEINDNFTEINNYYKETPDNKRHKITIKVEYEKRDIYWQYQMFNEKLQISLDQTFVTAGLVGRNVHLRHKAYGKYTDYVPFVGYLSYTNTYIPILTVEDKTSAKEYAGDVYDEKFYLSFGLETFDYEVTGSLLKIYLHTPGKVDEAFKRVIFDKIGFVDRYYEKNNYYQSNLPKNSTLQIEASLFQILFAPSIVPENFLNQVRYDFFNSYTDFLPLKEEFEKGLISVSDISHEVFQVMKNLLFFQSVAFGTNSDLELMAYADALLVKYYQKTPRIFITDFTSIKNNSRIRFDLCKNEGYILSYAGTSTITEYLFRSQKSITDMWLEDDVP